jgi:phosphohistidine swiveling domain-containing protein
VALVDGRRSDAIVKYILRGDSTDVRQPLGGKARGLAALRPAGLPIPAWIALTPDALHESLSPDQRQALRVADNAAALVAALEQVQPSPTVMAELQAALGELCPAGEQVAVRSSAADEDGVKESFAGQLDSFLCVPPGEVAEKVAAVWRSGFSARVLAYRRERGLAPVPQAPAVLIQRMIHADAAGVAFGADPVTGCHDVAVICAVSGLGAKLVAGECDADTYHVHLQGNISRPHPDGRAAILDDTQVRAVADLVRRTGEFLGCPQDVEWAFADGQLYLLQARPITTLATAADPVGTLQLWDNSNIAESYNGVTTPLTFSFARRAYEEVYRQFCRLLRVPAARLAQNDDVFRHMLGLIRGRVYYNLGSWYRALALLPGFTVNRRFMEQMMGVKEGLPEAIAAKLASATWRERLRDAFHLLGSLGALIACHLTLRRRTRRFRQRLEQALGGTRPDLSRLRADELAAYYRDIESQLLMRWDAPLVNDFLAMIFFGVLRKCVERWCPDAEGTLQNDLVGGEGGMISAEPALRLRAMAQTAVLDPALTRTLCEGTVAEAVQALRQAPGLWEQYESYLEKFGDRCLEELKLESPTLHDDPALLLHSVGQLARRLQENAGSPPVPTAPDNRRRAEERVRQALRFHPLRRLLFSWVLRHARGRVRDRENLRFERTRLFGRARQIFVELGRQFHAAGLLDQPRDAFYLEVEEILGFIEGTTTCTDLRGLAAVRRAEFDRYRQTEPPPGRFETRGPVHLENSFRGAAKADEPAGEQRQGLGCSPGVVRGMVRVITDPRSATLHSGEILVAERTDPGWILLFPAAAGLIVERGSLLSHSAIVARELGIPAVVSLPGATRWLLDGEWVELDGGRGLVTKVPPPREAGHG